MSRTYFLNAEFDLSLRARPLWQARPTLRRQVEELSLQALIGATAQDAALLRCDVDDSFIEHLRRQGIEVPQRIRRFDDGILTPHGWNAEAIELNARSSTPVPHPSLDVVERVNSRRFALALETSPPGEWIDQLSQLERWVAAHPCSSFVIKGDHGNSGLANRRLTSTLDEADRKFAERLLEEDDGFIVEPWFDRVDDWCYVFDVPFRAETFRVYEMIGTTDGALIGSLFYPSVDDPGLGPEAERIASVLAAEGYVGPVCCDALRYRDGDALKLRPLVDLNARRSVTDPGYRLYRQRAAGRFGYYRYFNRKKFSFPQSIEELQNELTPREIVITSPLTVGKIAALFVADERDTIFENERWFRDRYER